MANSARLECVNANQTAPERNVAKMAARVVVVSAKITRNALMVGAGIIAQWRASTRTVGHQRTETAFAEVVRLA